MTSVSQKEILQKNALSHEFPKKVKLAYLQKRWIQGIESQRQTSRKLDANVQNTQPPTRFHPDWNMTKAILFGSPFLGGVNTVKACFLFICNNRCKFAVRTLHFGTPNPPSTLLFLQGSQRDWKSPLDVPQKTTGTQRLWAKDASVPRAKVGMSTDLMCPPKKKRS